MTPDEWLPEKTLGFIVNPVAGMGGAVGLKGTDGKETLRLAVELGAKPVAPLRAEAFLRSLEAVKEGLFLLVGAAGMGQEVAAKLGFRHKVIEEEEESGADTSQETVMPVSETTGDDTRRTAKAIMKVGVDLLVFCGGDGTARDVFDAVGTRFPVLGVPTGVKMHSAVFATNPTAAAVMVARYLWEGLPLREAEVMDVDEEAFRSGRLSAKLYGYVFVPYEPRLVQASKLETPMTESELNNQAGLALYVIEEMRPGIMYIMGPGTTTRTVADLLEEGKTLLGVDLFLDKKRVATDVNEAQILELTKGLEVRIFVTPIGGQGFIFGRGNQQISPRVIRQIGLGNIIVIATRGKLRAFKSLRVDTGDPELDKQLAGFIRVVTDYRQEQMVRVE
ncbi:ATP-NAD kinase family protein [Candidatus Bathyarchaeota archaeon]|nr:ATP-NAD kinase family protein [Candidatus Bathyarchaeota archaeon]